MLGLIFRKAQNRIQDPANLRQLVVELIDKEQWFTMSADICITIAANIASTGILTYVQRQHFQRLCHGRRACSVI